MPRPLVLTRKPARLRILGALLRHPSLWPLCARLLIAIGRDFFWPQYRLRAFPRGRRILFVDGPLDHRIPFRPEYFATYLGFVSLLVRTLSYTRRQAGAASLPGWKKTLVELESLYREAGAISREWPTTTVRALGLRGPRMALIKFFDPHYHCLPSLHILIIALTFLRYQEWRRDAADVAGENAVWEVYLRREMMEIAESVLYVKQHSVSCIAGSLFFLTAKFPEADEAFVEDFIQSLFESEHDVPAEEIRAFIGSLYREFLARHRDGIEPSQVLIDYLRTRG